MTRFRVAPEVFDRFPTYLLAGVVITGLTAARAYPDLKEQLAVANAACAARLRGVDPKTLPEIAVWRAAFQRLGISASTYQSAVEALARRAAKGNAVPSIAPAVDLGNLASLRFLVPIGAHDTATWHAASLDVRLAALGDTFQPAGSDAIEQPDIGEIVYVTGAQVRTRRWVWRQSQQARIGPDAVSILYPIDGFTDATGDAVRSAQAMIAERASAYGATVQQFRIDRDTPSAVWPSH
jgi:DNA/RNA-binding domain of Phe-tRNA-synthetase-like protein